MEELKALPNGYVQGLLGWYLHFLALMSLRASEEINYCPKEVQYCARCTEQGGDGGGVKSIWAIDVALFNKGLQSHL